MRATKMTVTSVMLGLLLLILGGCASESPRVDTAANNRVKIGSFKATYDAQSGEVTQTMLPAALDGSLASLSPDQSAGAVACAIMDSSKASNEQGYCMGLINPESCTADYNPTTHVLSFYAKLVNRSNLPNSAPYSYLDLVNFPLNTTFYAPFEFIITGMVPSSGNPGLITNVNTNRTSAACGQDGLNLNDPNDDSNGNGYFDCTYPDQTYLSSYTGYPGWDFSPYVSNGRMQPGDDTGCVQFMQFTVSQNASFTLYFDLLAVKDDGSLPSKPTVTSHSDGDYVKTSSITLAGANCTAGATVYVEGGSSTVSTTCTGGGTYSLSVSMNLNVANNLNVYQIASFKQSASTSLTITHDNVAPTVAAFSPANGQSSVSQNTNCLVTFSEAMKTSTFTSTNLQLIRVSNSSSYTGTITASSDSTQALITSNPKPLPASNQFDCKALTGLTDLAGNALAATNTARFTTAASGGIFSDLTPPKVRNVVPFDNASNVSTNTTFAVLFDEPINPSTVNGNVIDSACNPSGGNIPNIFVFELNSCNASPQPITGTTSLSADGLLATFTPNNPLDITNNNCFGFVISSCVKDLSGNALASRGTRNIGAYNGDNVIYNSYSVFFTGSGDTTNPTLVHVGPLLSSTNVHERIFPFLIFDEAIDPATVIGDNLFMTINNQPTHLALKLQQDPTAQYIQLQPTNALTTSTTYVASVTGAVHDFAGNQMASPQTSNFTVTGSSDSIDPTVVKVTPTSGSNINDKCPYIDIYFSEPMDTATLNGNNLQLIADRTPAIKPTSIEIDDDAMHVRMIPVSSLDSGNGTRNDYTISIGANVSDRAGRTLGSASTHSFQVFTDTTVPSVISVVPAASGTISQNGNVAIFFSEEMDKSTINDTNITMTGCTPIIFADPAGKWAVANCINDLTTGLKTLTVSREVRDFYNSSTSASCEDGSGNRMAANYTSVFTVAAGQDTTAPTISTLSSVSPQDGTTSVATSVTPSVTFSEALDPRTVMPTSFFLMDSKGNRISADISISSDAKTLTLTPLSALSSAGIYYIIATTALRDLGGGNPYDGAGGENVAIPGVLRSCFSTNATACP